jgi:hypothetical protein
VADNQVMLPKFRLLFLPRLLSLSLGVFVLCGALLAAKEFVQPAVHPAQAFAANDDHKDEQVAVAIDPYDMQDKAEIFSVNYRSMGLLPVRLIITNDSDQPISLTQMKPTLVTVNRTKLLPLAPDDIFRRLSHPEPSERKLPLPIPPGKKIKGGVKQQVHDEVEAAHFSAEAVEPHSTRAGFLFFDVQDISTPLAGAHFYLTGVRNDQGNDLMYFEIPLEKYLSTAK